MNALKLPKKPKTKLIQAYIDESIAMEFIKQVDSDGIFIKQAIEYGMRAYIEASRNEKQRGKK